METGGVETSHGASADKNDVGTATFLQSIYIHSVSQRDGGKYLDSAMVTTRLRSLVLGDDRRSGECQRWWLEVRRAR